MSFTIQTTPLLRKYLVEKAVKLDRRDIARILLSLQSHTPFRPWEERESRMRAWMSVGGDLSGQHFDSHQGH